MAESAAGASAAAGGAATASGSSSAHRELSEKYLHYGEKPVAILISDMEGFTQTTRRLGIIHFASMILRMRATLRPVWEECGAIHVFTEADNFWVIFPDAASAVRAALQAQHALADYNATVQNPDFQIRLSGYGIEKGVGVWQDKHEGKFYGPVVDQAFHLGEDVVDAGGIIVGEKAYEELKSLEEFSHLKFEEAQDEEVVFWKVTGEQAKSYKSTASPHPNTRVEQLLSRTPNHNDPEKLAAIDADIKQDLKKYAAVMYGCDWPGVAEKYSTETMLVLRERCAELVNAQMTKLGGIRVEPNFYIFEDPVNCVIASMNSREAIKAYNRNAIAQYGRASSELSTLQIPFNGAGIHYGDMLFVEGTDVHWGDPVNTASKLGEDLARDMQILVSAQLWDLIREAPTVSQFTAEKRTLTASKADLTCYSVAFRSQSLQNSSSKVSLVAAQQEADSDVIRRLGAMEERFERLEKTQVEILNRLAAIASALTPDKSL